MINFASDNSCPVHPSVLKKLSDVNTGAVSSYGTDKYTMQATDKFKEIFGADYEAFFVFNGTGANTVGLDAMANKFSMILSPMAAHIGSDECGAPTKITGCPIYFVTPTPRKLIIDDLVYFLEYNGNVHKSQPSIVSISQATEKGDIYTVQELKIIRKFCDDANLFLHIDATRIANAAVTLGCSLKDAVYGADIFSFGGTKNGLMCAEAVVTNNTKFSAIIPYIRKQNMQLASKMRYISAQFLALFENDLWKHNATNANNTLKKLYNGIKNTKGINILSDPQANIMFINMPIAMAKYLQKTFYFYTEHEFDGMTHARIVTSWDTDEKDVQALIEQINKFQGL